MREKEER